MVPVTEARVTVDEHLWDRATVDGSPHDHTFVQSAREVRTVAVTADARATHVVSGVRDLVLLKSTGSEFHGFLVDDYTTLQPTTDRVMATALTARWRWTAVPDDADGACGEVREVLVSRFGALHSLALQQTLWEMGCGVLEARGDVAEIRLSAPNRHHFLADLEPFGLENPGEVFYAADRPYGLIEVEVAPRRPGRGARGLVVASRLRREPPGAAAVRGTLLRHRRGGDRWLETIRPSGSTVPADGLQPGGGLRAEEGRHVGSGSRRSSGTAARWPTAQGLDEASADSGRPPRELLGARRDRRGEHRNRPSKCVSAPPPRVRPADGSAELAKLGQQQRGPGSGPGGEERVDRLAGMPTRFAVPDTAGVGLLGVHVQPNERGRVAPGRRCRSRATSRAAGPGSARRVSSSACTEPLTTTSVRPRNMLGDLSMGGNDRTRNAVVTCVRRRLGPVDPAGEDLAGAVASPRRATRRTRR